MDENKQSNELIDAGQDRANFGSDRDIFVSAAHLASVLPFVSTEPTRFYLNGVFITPAEQGGVCLVATNGHIMAVAHDPDGRAAAPFICSVPKVALSALRKTTLSAAAAVKAARYVAFAGQSMHVLNNTFQTNADPNIIGKTHLASCFAPPIDGTYPEWAHVFPANLKDRHAAPATGFNSEYLKVFEGIGRVMTGTKCSAVSFQTGEPGEPVVVWIDGAAEWVGIIMPMKVSDAALQLPTWVTETSRAA